MSEVLAQASDLERLLSRRGVDVFGFERIGREATVKFTWGLQKYRLRVEMPLPTDPEFRVGDGGSARRSIAAIRAAYEREVSRRWGALRHLLGAKLDAIEVGVTDFDTEFRHYEEPVAQLAAGGS